MRCSGSVRNEEGLASTCGVGNSKAGVSVCGGMRMSKTTQNILFKKWSTGCKGGRGLYFQRY